MVKKIFLYGLYVCIIVTLITLIILSFTDKAGAPESKAKSTTAGKSLEKSKSPKVATDTPKTTPKPPSSSSSNKPPTSTPKSNSNSSQLTNTGPGDLVAIFATATVAGTIGFHLRQRKVV